eukprot:2038643-Rhodomonas_salina.1
MKHESMQLSDLKCGGWLWTALALMCCWAGPLMYYGHGARTGVYGYEASWFASMGIRGQNMCAPRLAAAITHALGQSGPGRCLGPAQSPAHSFSAPNNFELLRFAHGFDS